ncbi:HTTM domain-containing protein [Haloparvum sedimenti]|uniref:HTTM domain-containing protein n=1 Tax=Haloparvum sedimenti TaxID=1678448 RepID=UPI00071E8255|nr:HTTM domain-containing protein [Haloparvum sedimenti]
MTVREHLDARLGADARGLAAFRIALGVVLIVDLALRSRELTAFYTDEGVLPRSTLVELYPAFSRYSLHAASGEGWAVALLFLLAAAVAAALAVGYRTRTAALLSLVLVASLQARNPLVLNAGDTLLWQLLALACLLPLGRRWSVDAVRRTRRDGRRSGDRDGSASEPDRARGFAPALLLTFVVVLYLSNGLVKLRGDAWPGGTAVPQVFRLEHLSGPLGGALAGADGLLTVGTYAWLGLVLASPLLLLFTGRARTALAGAFVAAHLSMALTLAIGVFPLVSVAALLPFFPPRVWDAVERRLDGSAERLRNSVVAVSGAAVAAFPTVPGPIRARPGVGRVRRRLPEGLAAVLLVSLLAWNAMALGLVAAPAPVADAADPTENRWDMFAPNPPNTASLVLATAETADGGARDALYGDPVARNRTPSDARAYPSARWRKYLTAMPADPPDDRDERLGAYLCERAAAAGDGTVERVTVSFVYVDVTLGEPRGEPTAVEVLDRQC